jgi:hypothetical protein
MPRTPMILHARSNALVGSGIQFVTVMTGKAAHGFNL